VRYGPLESWLRLDAEPLQSRLELVIERRPRRFQQRHLRNDHQIYGAGVVGSAKHLSNQSFSPVSDDCAAKLPRCHHPEPGRRPRPRCTHQREKAAVRSPSGVENVLKLHPSAQPPGRGKGVGRHKRTYAVGLPADFQRDAATARRLRPLARRRFSTWRPFLVAIRTRNPWVFFRRRRFG
jgi:hypothetical protein